MHFWIFFAGLLIIKYLGYLYFAMNAQLIIAFPFDSTNGTLWQRMESGCCWETAHFSAAESLGAENQLAYLSGIYQELALTKADGQEACPLKNPKKIP